MKRGNVIRHVLKFFKWPNGPSKKDCLFVLLLLTVLARHCLDTNGKTEAAGGGHLTATPGPGGRLPDEARRSRTPLPTADLLSFVGVAGAAGNSSDSEDSAMEDEGEECGSAGACDGEPPSEVSCLASRLRRSLRLDDEGDAGFAEPPLCPGQPGLLALGGEYKPMAVWYTECSLGATWCPQWEQCLPTLRSSVVLRRESWPLVASPRAGAVGAVRSPTQPWRSVRMLLPDSCYCGPRQHPQEDAQLHAAAAADHVSTACLPAY